MRPDKPDAVAKDLYANLERENYVVQRIAKSRKNEKGVPDALVSRRGDIYRINHLLEVKSLGGRLSNEQREFAMNWPGCVHVATNSWEAIQLFKECEERKGRK